MYSWVMGFSIRCGNAYVGKKGKLMMKELCRQQEGHAKNATHATTRCGCKAMIRILLNEKSLWYVKVFVEEHSHPLVESCGEKKHLFSHKHYGCKTFVFPRTVNRGAVTGTSPRGKATSF